MTEYFKKDWTGDNAIIETQEVNTIIKQRTVAQIKKDYEIALEDIAHLEKWLKEAKERANNIVTELEKIKNDLWVNIEITQTPFIINKE